MSTHTCGKEVDREGYQRFAFVVNLVSQFMHNPKKDHLQVVFRILRYFKGSLEKGLLFSKQDKSLNVEAFTNAD